MRKTSPSPRNIALDASRGIAALVVLFYHVTYTLHFGEWSESRPIKTIELVILLPAKFGELAVYYFMILSGYVLSIAFKKLNHAKYSEWLIWRAIRLIPIYYIALSLSYLVTESIFHTTKFEISYLNHLYLFDNNKIYAGPNPPLWSLSVEIFLSLIFLLLFRLRGQNQHYQALCLVLLFSLSYFVEGWGERAILRSSIFFVMGILMQNRIYEKSNLQKIGKSMFFFLTFILLLVQLLQVPYANQIVTALQIVYLPLILRQLISNTKLVILRSRVLGLLGKMSFSLYVFHWPVLLVLQASSFFNEDIFKVKLIAVLVVSLVTILVTALLYFVIERPLKALCDVYASKIR